MLVLFLSVFKTQITKWTCYRLFNSCIFRPCYFSQPPGGRCFWTQSRVNIHLDYVRACVRAWVQVTSRKTWHRSVSEVSRWWTTSPTTWRRLNRDECYLRYSQVICVTCCLTTLRLTLNAGKTSSPTSNTPSCPAYACLQLSAFQNRLKNNLKCLQFADTCYNTMH